jgi:hypothetical protein
MPPDHYFAAMKAKRRSKPKRKESGISLNWPFRILVAAAIGFTVVLAMHIHESPRLLVSWTLFAMACGVLFEFRMITQRWTVVLWSTLGAFMVSFLAFIPGKYEHVYNLEDHIKLWPYVFCVILAFIAATIERKKATIWLDEGWTLLLTLSFGYWLLDKGVFGFNNAASSILGICVLLLLCFVIAQVIFPSAITKRGRLWLSVWSAVIMTILAVDNIIQVFGMGNVEEATSKVFMLRIFVSNFLVGMASIYLARNLVMLLGFIPDRDHSGYRNYRKNLKKLKREHVERYAETQLDSRMAVWCCVLVCGAFGLNMVLELVPVNTMIWLTFLVIPRLLRTVFQPAMA